MTERAALTFVLWALGVMIVIGALLPLVWPGLIRFFDRTVLKENDTGNH